jgi:hypothetical protein
MSWKEAESRTTRIYYSFANYGLPCQSSSNHPHKRIEVVYRARVGDVDRSIPILGLYSVADDLEVWNLCVFSREGHRAHRCARTRVPLIVFRPDIERDGGSAAQKRECKDRVGWVLRVAWDVALAARDGLGVGPIPEHDLVVLLHHASFSSVTGKVVYTHRDSGSASVLVPLDIVLGNDSPRSMWKSVNVLDSNSPEVDIVVDVPDVVRLGIVVPRYDLDNIRLNIVDGLLPSVVPERVAELDPVV